MTGPVLPPPRIALSPWLFADGRRCALTAYILHGTLPDEPADVRRLRDAVNAAMVSGYPEETIAAARALDAALHKKFPGHEPGAGQLPWSHPDSDDDWEE